MCVCAHAHMFVCVYAGVFVNVCVLCCSLSQVTTPVRLAGGTTHHRVVAESHNSSSPGGSLLSTVYLKTSALTSTLAFNGDTTALSAINVSLVFLCNSLNEKVDVNLKL